MMANNSFQDINSPEYGRGTQLLYALNAAAASLQRSARSEEEVLNAVSGQMSNLELRGGLSILDNNGENLIIRAFSQPGRLLERLESLTGFRIEGYEFPAEKIDVYRQVIKEGKTIFVQDSGVVISQMLPEMAQPIAQSIISELDKSPAIFSPLLSDGQVCGVLNVVGDGLSPGDIPAMEAFANHVAIALDNASLFAAMQKEVSERKEAEEALRRRAKELAALHALSLDINAIHDPSQLMHKLVERAALLLNAKSGGLYLCETKLRQVRCVVSYNTPRDYTGIVLEYGDGTAGTVAQTGEPLIIDDYRTWPGRASFFEEDQPFGAVIAAPMIWKDQVVGVIVVVADVNSTAFNHAELELLTLFANQAAVAFENVRLFEAEHTARERAEALRDAARIMGSTLSLDQVLEAILEQLARVLHFDTGNVILVEGKRLIIKVGRGYESFVDSKIINEASFDVDGDQTVGAVVRSGKPLAIADVKQDSRWVVDEMGEHIHSWMGVPLFVRDECIGLFSLDRVTPDGFHQEELALAQTFALHASAAIENAGLFEREGKRAAELEAVRQASLGLTASLELHEVLDAILENVIKLLPDVNNGHIFLYNSENGGRLMFGAALWSDGLQTKAFSNPRHEGLTYSVARGGEAIIVPDLQKHQLYAEAPRAWSGAIVGLPLKMGSRVVGVMNVSYSQPRDFSNSELRLLRLLGDQAAIAIENARLFERAATEQRHLSLLYDLGQEIAASLDPDEILKRAITLTSRKLEGQVGQAYLYMPDENRLSMRAIYGRSETYLAELEEKQNIFLGVGLVGWVTQHRQAVYVPDVSEDPRWLPVAGIDDDIRSAMCVPILAGDNLLGAFSVLHVQEAAFSTDQLTLLGAICQEVALALSNASQYQAIQRRLAEMTLIQNLVHIFNQRLEVQVLLDEVVVQLAQKLGYPQVEILLVENETLVQRAFYGATPPWERLMFSQGIVGRVARTGKVALVIDVTQDPDYRRCYEDTVAELAVPIYHGKVVVGIINIETHNPDQLSTQDRDLVEVLAGQISIALERAVLYERVYSHAEDLEHKVAQRTAELVELFELSQEIGYTHSYEDLLRLLLGHLRNAIQTELVAGGLFINGNHIMAVDTTRTITPKVLDKIKSYCMGVIPQQEKLVINNDDVSIEENIPIGLIPEGSSLEQVNSMIHAPIMAAGKLVGLLIAATENEERFGREQERLLDTFANHASQAIQRLAANLVAEQKRLESLVEHLPIGVLLLDSEYRILVTNPLGKRILAVLNNTVDDSLLTQLGSTSIGSLTADYNNAIPIEIVVEGPPSRIFEAQALPVIRENHQWVVTLREVTQERETQARIQMQDRLATVGQLAAGIAHDFNNIMAAILVYADLINRDPNLPPASRDQISIIQEQVHRSASLIRQILDFSRRSIMEQSPLDLLPFMKELDKMLERVMPETIRLDLSYQEGSYVVIADPTRLQQVFMNLAVNARDAMPDGGLLHYELSCLCLRPGEQPPITDMVPGEWVRISVTDTGIGIPPENLPHMFEPFFTTKPAGEGTGLGLAQVYGIIKQHGGYIDVESQIGKGTTFTMCLPAFPTAPGEDNVPDSQTYIDGIGDTVLVVEDDRATLEALRALLDAHSYNVLTALNGVEALERIEREPEPISLVVSDVVMPEMGGVDLYLALQERWPNVKILFVTGHPLEGKNQALLERGDVHWLQKPFSVKDFSYAVNTIMEE